MLYAASGGHLTTFVTIHSVPEHTLNVVLILSTFQDH